MSLNRTLGRLFDEIRREAKRNPAFADRLDAVLRAHESARDVPDAVLEEVASDDPGPPASSRFASGVSELEARGPEVNPVALYIRDGAEALRIALAALADDALAALVEEHHLDPAGAAAGMTGHDLIEHIVAQAEKRVTRDRKLFDY
jgi:hypothetical protein